MECKRFLQPVFSPKTLRFKLEPVGKTEEFIERAQVLENDERRAAEYKKVKDLIDNYHRWFIEQALSAPLLKVDSTGDNDSLEDFSRLLQQRHE